MYFHAFTDLEPVPFNRGFFTVDIKYFFNVTLEVFRGVSRPTEIHGLSTFDKKVILFGSEGNAKIFSSKYNPDSQIPSMWKKNNLPKAVVEVVDPIALSAKLVDKCSCNCCCDCDLASIPSSVCQCFDDDLVMGNEEKLVFVTLGLFTIIKIERNVQLLIPVFDFCYPNKECIAATEENPCDLFSTLRFPLDEFFPPLADEFDPLIISPSHDEQFSNNQNNNQNSNQSSNQSHRHSNNQSSNNSCCDHSQSQRGNCR